MSSSAYPKSLAEWNCHRATIHRLYLVEDRPLKEVQQIMETQFGFKATTRMYTIRISKWGLNKNYKAQEKEILAIRIAEAVIEGQSLSNITFRGQAINLSRILRHSRSKAREKGLSWSHIPSRCSRLQSQGSPSIEKQKDSTVTLELSAKSRAKTTPITLPIHTSDEHTGADVISIVNIHSRKSADDSYVEVSKETSPLLTLIPCSVSGASPGEIILLATDSYVKNVLEENCSKILSSGLSGQIFTKHDIGVCPVQDTSVPKRSPYKFQHDLETALYLLKVGSESMGWSVLHATCGNIAEVVLSQPLSLLRITFTTLSPGNTWKFPEIRKLLLKFLASMLQIKLAKKTSEAALYLMGSTFEKRLGFYHDETLRNYRALIKCQRRNKDLTAAESFALALVERSKSCANETRQFQLALSELAHILKDQLRYEEAITLCKRILDHHPNALDELNIYTREDIAELQRLRGDLLMESIYLSEALTASLRFFGGEAPSHHIWDKFKVSLMAQGRNSEVLHWEQLYVRGTFGSTFNGNKDAIG